MREHTCTVKVNKFHNISTVHQYQQKVHWKSASLPLCFHTELRTWRMSISVWYIHGHDCAYVCMQVHIMYVCTSFGVQIFLCMSECA